LCPSTAGHLKELIEAELFVCQRRFTGAVRTRHFLIGLRRDLVPCEIKQPRLSGKTPQGASGGRIQQGWLPLYNQVNVRIIAATNNLTKAHDYQEDLFYRLNVISIHIPSLRQRREDIPSLYFILLKIFKNVRTTKSAVLHLLPWRL
jgi:hypothetical protein